MINRRIPSGMKKIDLDQILKFEKSKNYSGKSFNYLNAVNSLIKRNDRGVLKLKIENQAGSLEKGKSQEIKLENTQKQRPEKPDILKTIDKILDVPSINEVIDDNSMLEKDALFIDESEREKIKKKKKKRRRNNPSRN
jgi:hypothetical protein